MLAVETSSFALSSALSEHCTQCSLSNTDSKLHLQFPPFFGQAAQTLFESRRFEIVQDNSNSTSLVKLQRGFCVTQRRLLLLLVINGCVESKTGLLGATQLPHT